MHRIFYMRGKHFRTYLNNKYDDDIDNYDETIDG